MVTAKKRSGPPAEIGDVDLRQVLEHIVQGVIVIDSERRVLTWNDHYQELMGFPEDVLKIGARAETLSLFLARRGDYGAGEPSVQPHLKDSQES